MYKLRAQQNDDHNDSGDCFDPSLPLDYDNEMEAHANRKLAAEEYAMTWYADVYHDDFLGMSTVYFDDGQYTLFEVRESK